MRFRASHAPVFPVMDDRSLPGDMRAHSHLVRTQPHILGAASYNRRISMRGVRVMAKHLPAGSWAWRGRSERLGRDKRSTGEIHERELRPEHPLCSSFDLDVEREEGVRARRGVIQPVPCHNLVELRSAMACSRVSCVLPSRGSFIPEQSCAVQVIQCVSSVSYSPCSSHPFGTSPGSRQRSYRSPSSRPQGRTLCPAASAGAARQSAARP